MATYNGGRFLTMQLDSIMGQTYQDWHLYVHDDGSSDETTEILQKYEQEHHKDISILHYPPQGGSCSNFLSLLERVDAKYYMFADQDDIWHTKKIEKSMVIMHKMEQIHPDIPIIIHSDLRIIDEHQTTLHNSFFQYSNIHPEQIVRYEEYIQNIVTGSTMLFNHHAKTCAFSKPFTHATMHDAWVTLRAIAEGGMRYTIYEPLTDYRQHRNNVMGALNGRRFTLRYRLVHAKEMIHMNIAHYRMMNSAGSISLYTFLKNKYKFFIHNRGNK